VLPPRAISTLAPPPKLDTSPQGIGKAYAKALARAGLDVVLVSRSKEKLAAVEGELRAKFPSRAFRALVADFSEPAESGLYERLATELAGVEVGVLVNNVGQSYPGALYFHELPEHASPAGMLHVNVDSVVGMTRAVLPRMLARGRGAILNVSSAAGRMPIGNPMYALYSGAKAFVDYFSRSLAEEYGPKGLIVACHAPYFVATKMSRIRAASLFTPSPDAWAAASLGALGNGAASAVPYWPHALQDAVVNALPTPLLRAYVMPLHAGLRRRFLAKAGKSQ
jgi:17beta-estradiol 17-dehydrogenase / very-long-chain 3-oxoacyl-CoA reductase